MDITRDTDQGTSPALARAQEGTTMRNIAQWAADIAGALALTIGLPVAVTVAAVAAYTIGA